MKASNALSSLRSLAVLGAWTGYALIFSGGAALGDWEQTHKLIAGDGAPEDCLAVSVSVGGNLIVVGAYGDDDADEDSGSAYVFDATTGEQLHKLTADDAAEGDSFGYSVSISGNLIVIGAYRDDNAGEDSGSAYVFDATTGEQLRKLTADDAAKDDTFGTSVSISGSLIVVGSLGDDDAGSDSGSAYVFDATTGEQLRKLTADDAAAEDRFGTCVSIDGNLIVVGSMGDDDAGENSGSAYVFDATTGEQLRKLTADDAAAEDYFGICVSIRGNLIVVGCIGDDDAGENSGSAYVFDAVTGAQLHKLTADDGTEGDVFGYSVFIGADLLVVGALGDSHSGMNSGSAYVFDPATGEQRGKLVAEDAAQQALFGRSVSLAGQIPVIGAVGDRGYTGSVYLFEYRTPCPSDINGDGFVDVADLLQLLGDWGPCP